MSKKKLALLSSGFLLVVVGWVLFDFFGVKGRFLRTYGKCERVPTRLAAPNEMGLKYAPQGMTEFVCSFSIGPFRIEGREYFLR